MDELDRVGWSVRCSDIRTTLNLYVHPGLEQKRRCLDRMVRAME